MEEKKTNYEFKILYVLGMLLVISGHYGSGLMSFRQLFPYDTFHIPLFVFASGYFFKIRTVSNKSELFAFLRRKFRRLVIPYYLWMAVYLVVGYLLNKYTIMDIQGGITSFVSFFTEPILYGHGAEYNVSSWFLLTLFFVEACYAAFRYFCRAVSLTDEYLILMILLLLAVAAQLLSAAETVYSMKRILVQIGYLMFWYDVGYVYHSKWEAITRRRKNWQVLIPVIAAAFLLRMFYDPGKDVISVIFSARFYPNIPYVFFRTALGITFWLRVSFILTPWLKNCRPVLYFADHTFSLLMHQGMAGLVINTVIRHFFPARIEDSLFTTQIWYHLNTSRHIWTVIYVLLIPVMILVPVFLYDRVKNRIKGKNREAVSG